MLPLRVDLSGDPAVTELLGRMRRVCLDAYAHQEAPFERVVERLAPERDLSRPPVFQAMLALQDVEQAKLACPGLEITEWRLDTGVAKYDLTLDVDEVAGEMRLDLEYNATSSTTPPHRPCSTAWRWRCAGSSRHPTPPACPSWT